MKTYVDANVLIRLYLDFDGSGQARDLLTASKARRHWPLPVPPLLLFEVSNGLQRMVFEIGFQGPRVEGRQMRLDVRRMISSSSGRRLSMSRPCRRRSGQRARRSADAHEQHISSVRQVNRSTLVSPSSTGRVQSSTASPGTCSKSQRFRLSSSAAGRERDACYSKIQGPQPPTARTERREDALSRLIKREDIHPLKGSPQDVQFAVGTHDLFRLSRLCSDRRATPGIVPGS